jgi:FAD/FMN-containing dehydrogenase
VEADFPLICAESLPRFARDPVDCRTSVQQSCASLLLGGGFKAMSRVHALTIDALVAAQVVLADGRIVRTDARSMQDLFWALRGGGASFGAVTEMTLRTRPWQPQYLVVQHWPWDRAADVLTAWSAWISSMPADSSSSLVCITHRLGAS